MAAARELVRVPLHNGALLLCALFFSVALRATAVHILPAEESALLELKQRARPHRELESWVKGGDCEEWEGVECDEMGHVLAIDALPVKELDAEVRDRLPFLESGSTLRPVETDLHLSAGLTWNPRRASRRTLHSDPSPSSSSSSSSSSLQRVAQLIAPAMKSMAAWEKSAKNTKLVGVMSRPRMHAHAKREVLVLNSSQVAGKDELIDCYKGLPAAKVVEGFEDSGMISGVVTIRRKYLDGWVLLCSGALLAPNLVLTAGHCVYDLDFGGWIVNSPSDMVIYSRYNGQFDSTYSSATYSTITVFQQYLDTPTWEDTLNTGCDLAVIKLSRALKGQTYSWTAPVQGPLPRTNVGYPGITQDGSTMIFDVSSVKLRLGCNKLNKAIMCEDVSTEAGMSGGPIFNGYESTTLLGTLSGGYIDACPALYTSLNGSYPLTTLVTLSGCKYSKKRARKADMGDSVYKASC